MKVQIWKGYQKGKKESKLIKELISFHCRMFTYWISFGSLRSMTIRRASGLINGKDTD